MSFIQKLNTTQTLKYSVKNDITIEDIVNLFDSLKPSKSREIVIQTGIAGAQQFNKLWMIEVYEAHSTELLEKGKIDVEECNRLSKMLQSPDEENFEVAKIIIDNLMCEVRTSAETRLKIRSKSHQNDTHIQSRRSQLPLSRSRRKY